MNDRSAIVKALDEAVRNAGSQRALAEPFGLSQGAVSNWKSRGFVPSEYCARIEQWFRVPRWRFFPRDWHLIWPELVRRKDAPRCRPSRRR